MEGILDRPCQTKMLKKSNGSLKMGKEKIFLANKIAKMEAEKTRFVMVKFILVVKASLVTDVREATSLFLIKYRPQNKISKTL
jgi:hypothetical protein